MNTQRIEAFSDGVFAIAITLLILEVKVPHIHPENGESLAVSLKKLWPSYGVYVLSFVTVGIYWANHHFIFNLYKKADHVFNLLNVLFLMCISFLPFPTAVLGEYLTNMHERQTAVIFYAFGLWLPAITWMLNWLYASYRYRLIDPKLDPAFIKTMTLQYVTSSVVYTFSILASLWSSRLGLVICVGVTLFYLMPPKRPVYRES